MEMRKLTEHDIEHLNIIVKEAYELRDMKEDIKLKHLDAKKIPKDNELKFIDRIIKDVEKIIESGEIPNFEFHAFIHDYIEKNTKVDLQWQTLQ